MILLYHRDHCPEFVTKWRAVVFKSISAGSYDNIFAVIGNQGFSDFWGQNGWPADMTFQNQVVRWIPGSKYTEFSKTSIPEKLCKMQINSLFNTADKIYLNYAYSCELRKKREFRFDTGPHTWQLFSLYRLAANSGTGLRDYNRIWFFRPGFYKLPESAVSLEWGIKDTPTRQNPLPASVHRPAEARRSPSL